MKEYIVSEDSYAYEMRRYDELKELIRCKDCKHWSCDDDESFCSELGIFNTDKESYCSYAKRKK